MKIVGIDIEALKKRWEELQAELNQIEQVLAIAEKTDLPGVTVTEREHKTRSVNNTGIRRICLLQLFTGPCTADEIARVTNQDLAVVRTCLRTMLVMGIVAEEKNGRFILTAKGRAMAKWHQENPRFVTYQGGPIAG